MRFAPTTYPSRLAIMARISSYTDDGTNTVRFVIRDGSKDIRVGLEASDILTLHTSGTVVGGGRVTTDGNAVWVFCMIDLSGANGVQYLVNLSDPTRQMRASVQSDLATVTNEQMMLGSALSANATTAVVSTPELHFLLVNAP